MRKASIATPALVLAALTMIWAAPLKRAAQFSFQGSRRGYSAAAEPAYNGRVPATVNFRPDDARGLIVAVWVNQAGPFNFAVDTGVGTTLISEQAAARAGLRGREAQRVNIGGLGEIAAAS